MRILSCVLFLVSSVCAGEISIKFIEKDERGLLLNNESISKIFVYSTCSLDFKVISGKNSKIENVLTESEDNESRYKNHKQASMAQSHGYFVEAGKSFRIEYPPGYEMKTFPNRVLLRLNYRKVTNAEKGKLLLEESNTININLESDR